MIKFVEHKVNEKGAALEAYANDLYQALAALTILNDNNNKVGALKSTASILMDMFPQLEYQLRVNHPMQTDKLAVYEDNILLFQIECEEEEEDPYI